MTMELDSQFKASSFCCTLNNIDRLFDLNDITFDDEDKYSDETRKLVKEFRANLDPNKQYSEKEIVEQELPREHKPEIDVKKLDLEDMFASNENGK